MIVRIYRKYIPYKYREKIYRLFIERIIILNRYFGVIIAGGFVNTFSFFFPKNALYDAYRFIGKHGVTPYPFEASLKYKNIPVEVYYDTQTNLPYVLHNCKRLYYPRQANERKIQSSYRTLLIEQDIESSHRYVSSFEELDGKILLDIGAAEGIFTLDAIEYVTKAYIFEYKDCWIEPLKRTFKQWEDKVEIVKKYVSNKDDENTITLDTFMENREHDCIHVKMDIEGAEQEALKGAKIFLTNRKSVSFSICTYHKKNDAKIVSSFFEAIGYICEFTKGYIVFPYLRKAVCRGKNYVIIDQKI